MKATPTMTPRQLAEWERRAKAGDLGFPTIDEQKHGTHYAYQARGCRCLECRAFVANYRRNLRQRRRAEQNGNTKPVAGHATGSVAR